MKKNKIKQLKLEEKYYKELLTYEEKHDLTKHVWIQKLKWLKHNELTTIKTARKTQNNIKTKSKCPTTQKKFAHNHSSRFHMI